MGRCGPAVLAASSALAISACGSPTSNSPDAGGGNADGGVDAGESTIDAGFVPVATIGPGLFFTCVLGAGGGVQCWGYNANGTLGNGGYTDSPTPVAVSNLTGARAMVAHGSYDTCVLLADGTVSCWGDNFTGQLGQASLANSDVPVAAPGVTDVVQVSLAVDLVCALRSNGTVMCWGDNQYGQTGTGNPTSVASPSAVVGLTGAVAVSAGGFTACALLVDGTVQCWGDNEVGELGNGSSAKSAPAPVAVTGLTNVTAISTGYSSSCALRADGTVWCWGSNGYGEIGNGGASATTVSTPVQVQGLSGVTSVSVGDNCACAVLASGTATCWGYNDLGQLGDGTTTNAPTPVPVSGLTNVRAIVAGNDHSCAALTDGSYACWGNNQYGQLGDGTTTSSPVPVAVKP
jgi:alpha-tubulin suppressor-like RCC1 family protein